MSWTPTHLFLKHLKFNRDCNITHRYTGCMYVLHPFEMTLTRNNKNSHTQAYVITPSHNSQKKHKIYLLDKDYTVIQKQDTQSLHRIQETQSLIRIAQCTSLWQQWNLDPALCTICLWWMIKDENYKGENHIGSLLNLWLGLRTVMKRWAKECQEWWTREWHRWYRILRMRMLVPFY